MAISYFCSYCGAENTSANTHCIACQQQLDISSDASDISMLLNERYKVQTEVGTGGFSAVYKAQDMREQGRLVAIKQINLQGLSSQEMIEATDTFNREAQLLSLLDHPLLPHIFDRFNDPEHWYLVMSFIDGLSLDEYIQQQTASTLPGSGLPLAETLAIGLQICDVLHYLHTQQPPVIFRDLKPSNIMRTPTGRIYLIDFGIARRFKPGKTRDTIPFGSPGFAAPEQYGRAQTTPQADIYSLGALLHCLISGDDPSEHPFQFDALRLDDLDSISELDALIQQMIATNPTRRPADIEIVQAELQNILHIYEQAHEQPHIWSPPQGKTPPATGTGQRQVFLSTSNTKKPVRKTTRRRVLTASLLVGSTALIGGVAAKLIQQHTYSSLFANQQQADATATVIAQNEATATNQLATIPQNGPAYWSADFSYVAVANQQKRLLELYALENQQLLHAIPVYTDLSNLSVEWSPTNRYMAFFQTDGSGEIWDIKSLKFLFTTPPGRPNTMAAAWSADEESLAISYSTAGGNSIFSLLSPADGTVLFGHNLVGGATTTLAWSSDNISITFPAINTSSTEPGIIWELETWNSQTHQLTRKFNIPTASHAIAVIALVVSPDDQLLAMVSGSDLYGYLVSVCNPADHYPIFNPLTNTNYSKPLQGPVWSSDGTRLAMLTEKGLYAWDVASGQEIPVSDNNVSDKIVAFLWSEEDQAITAVDDNNVLSHWSVG